VIYECEAAEVLVRRVRTSAAAAQVRLPVVQTESHSWTTQPWLYLRASGLPNRSRQDRDRPPTEIGEEKDDERDDERRFASH
jgi:hypothetical protein